MESSEFRPKDPFNPTPEEMKAFYEKAKREFSTKDLLKFFIDEEGQPFEELITELEVMVKQDKSKGKENDAA